MTVACVSYPDNDHVVIVSKFPESAYVECNYFEMTAFKKACEMNGIPMDVPVSRECFSLAAAAFEAVCAWPKADYAHNSWYTGPFREDAPELWRQARVALTKEWRAGEKDKALNELRELEKCINWCRVHPAKPPPATELYRAAHAIDVLRSIITKGNSHA